MAPASNKYASKVYSEHPIALWSLDEEAYYIALADNNDRQFTNWTLTGCTAVNGNVPSNPSPFINDSYYSSLVKSSSASGTISAVSQDLFNSLNINSEDPSFIINLFLYQNPTYINWFKIGYRTTVSGLTYEELSDPIPAPTNISTDSWININEKFTLPVGYSGGVKMLIEINFQNSSGGGVDSRTVTMNGLSIGQGSELTCYENLGSTLVELPLELNLPSLKGIVADQYGMLSNNGYYLVKDNKLLAHNDGMSMIYGTDICTKIEPGPINTPSFVFPGKGMLHESGRNRDFTFEMWIKIEPRTSSAFKIIGPLDTNDGIYVKEGFITLVINKEIGSHYVGEWGRPMLINLILKESTASLLINGEQVINIPYDRENAELPGTLAIEEFISDPIIGNYEGRKYFNPETLITRIYLNASWRDSTISSNQIIGRDWWGIYSNSSFLFFSMDCIAIYPYTVSEIVAKRRFVYGQGTPSIQFLDSAYYGTPTTIDFATSQYGTGIMYPDTNRWDAGYFNNIDATRDYLSVPDYSLPIINIAGRDLQEWYTNNLTINNLEYPTVEHPKFITFRPNIVNGIWDINGINYQSPSYFNFPSLNVLNDKVAAIYAIFEAETDIAEDRTLINFSNILNGDSFDIKINSNKVYYYLNNIQLYNETITIGEEFNVGINFDNISYEFGYDVSRFFSSPSSIQVFVGGNGVNTFEGKIYNVSFCNQNNYDEISSNFYEIGSTKGGIINSSYANYQILINHIASYTLVPEYEYGLFFLDISVSSEWEDFYPLSYFAGYINDLSGNKIYDLDMLQLNIDYVFIEDSSIWSYSQMKNEFLTQTYNNLKTSQYSSSYFNLKKKNTTQTNINVGLSSVQGYITFQPLSSGANSPLSSFNYTTSINASHIIDVDAENTDLIPEKAFNTKFSFVNNMIILTPKSKDFNDYAMVIHLQIKQRSILKNPLKIKKLEISPKNFNYYSSTIDQKNIIGTKFGNNIYSYKENIFDTNEKYKIPYFISKKTTPYLYNSSLAGINVIEESEMIQSQLSEDKIIIPVNKSGTSNYLISALQFMINPKYIDNQTLSKIIEINHSAGTVTLELDRTSTNFYIKAYDKNGDGNIVSGGAPSANAYIDYFNGGTPSSTYDNYIYFNSQNKNQTTFSEFSYSPSTTISFYQNGKYVKNPILKNNEWTTIGIMFNTPLNFNDFYEGNILLYGGALFNNVSYYLSQGLGIKVDLNERTWNQVLYTPSSTFWLYWTGFDWQTVYLKGKSSSYSINPANIYDAYMGTNGEIVNDDYGISIHQSQTKIISGAKWSFNSAKPV